MSWAIKQPATGDNSTVYSDDASESQARPFSPGHFYDGNKTTQAKNRLVVEGSKGLARNQGIVRTSAVIEEDEAGDIGQNRNRIKQEKQGSLSQLNP